MSNHTPDPTPAFLPPAHLAEIRERADAPLRPMPDAEERAEYFGQAVSDRAALLAHLDDLTPRAAVDGEALGRGLYMEIHGATPGHDYMLALWSEWNHSTREAWTRAALALHAIGYAARASEGEAERMRLQDALDLATADIGAEEDAQAEDAATIARLTAELAEARAAVEAFRALPGYPHTEGVTPAMVKLRLEANGAREERDAILHDIYALPGAREYSGERATIVRAIRSRATEGRQGS